MTASVGECATSSWRIISPVPRYGLTNDRVPVCIDNTGINGTAFVCTRLVICSLAPALIRPLGLLVAYPRGRSSVRETGITFPFSPGAGRQFGSGITLPGGIMVGMSMLPVCFCAGVVADGADDIAGASIEPDNRTSPQLPASAPNKMHLWVISNQVFIRSHSLRML
ncbi:MAG: hypothetical protein ACYDBB_05570 [Armatimonadota bacterium]